jgi:MYXO-CTERM domain-containing protein
MRPLVFVLTAGALLASGSAAHAALTVSAVGDTQKIRPDAPPPAAESSIALSCAQNEICGFQIAASAAGAADAVSGITVGDLAGPSGQKLAGSSALVYREGFLTISTPSNAAGVTGLWPDPLIPDVDEFFGETRNAFPAPVAAGQTQGFWLEIHVPDGQAPGMYAGSVTVTSGGGTSQVALSIHVRGFSLPSTSSLASAYGFDWDGPCVGHFGGYGPPSCDDAGLEAINDLYFRDALNHRITISELVYAPPIQKGMGDFTSFDTLYGPYLSGTALTGANQLQGAKITTIEYAGDQVAASYAAWAAHAKANGWFDRVFDYTCDEPPNGCAWSAIPARAAIVHAGDPLFRTLTTTTIQAAQQNGVLSSLDILVPILNEMDGSSADPYPGDQRPQYDAFLMGANAELWMYQSCEPSSSCADGTVGGRPGFPTMFIDEAAITNRMMPWLDFEFQVGAELYYDTTHAMDTGDAWTTQYAFGNNGDGSIWYPGKPSVIGGTKDIPIESLRMKLIRAGMQDYEYLALLTRLGDGAFAQAQLATVVQGTGFTSDPGVLAAARLAMAAEIEKDMAAANGSGGGGAGGAGSGGGGAGTGGSGSGSKGSKGCSCQTAPDETPGWVLGALPLAAAWARRRSRARGERGAELFRGVQ